MSIQKRVLHCIKKEKMWIAGNRVCIAVSGGVDSMVLMHVLHRTQRAHGGILEVCTIDHQFRNTSKKECAYVVQEANNLGLPVQSLSLEVPPGGNLYERARKERQNVLLSLGCSVVATGHHQADQAETLLYRLLRGSGLDGLSSMKTVENGWCRPLLNESKEAILSYAQQENIQWFDDPSNAQSVRGILRDIFPLLDSIHGAAVPAIARTAMLLREDGDLLKEYTRLAWTRCILKGGLSLDLWKKEPKGMQIRLLRELCKVHEVPVRAQILMEFQRNPICAQLPKGQWLMSSQGLISVVSMGC